MGAFDWAGTHDWQVSTDHESDALPTAPRRPLKLKLMQGIGMVNVAEKQNSSNNTNNNDSSIYSSTMTALPKFITNQQRKQQH